MFKQNALFTIIYKSTKTCEYSSLCIKSSKTMISYNFLLEDMTTTVSEGAKIYHKPKNKQS